LIPENRDPGEVMVRIGARSDDPVPLNMMGAEITPVVTSGPPGVTGFAGGRPRPQQVIGYWPALIAKDRVKTTVTVNEV